MASEKLSIRVRDFLSTHVTSVAEMDILTIMCSDPARHWTARAIDGILCHNEGVISRRLLDFAKNGLALEKGGVPPAYQCPDFESPLGAALRETVEVYLTRPVKVIETIFKPEEDAAQQFADAFRIRSNDHG